MAVDCAWIMAHPETIHPVDATNASQFGLYYRLRSSKEIDWRFQRNALFLQDYIRSSAGRVEETTRITKEDIRQNRDNAAEKLGFLGRVVHGPNPRAWVKELDRRCGEAID